ncbi:hypothetical protein [uncultured Friedmanniella sp.]|uniref:hypothetical protein n=1 Tax=uncultured Friedmanniella sp. TaxID=335381 RepID=UPI0035CB499E
MGSSSAGLRATAFSAAGNFAAGATGSVANNMVAGQSIDLRQAALSGGVNTVGGAVSGRVGAPRGTNTLSQLSYFGAPYAVGP